jgi:hypothetical protein
MVAVGGMTHDSFIFFIASPKGPLLPSKYRPSFSSSSPLQR